MDRGEIIPEVALSNSNYRITRKRDSSVVSPHNNCAKRDHIMMHNEPDGPVHKKIAKKIEKRQSVIILDEDDQVIDSTTPTKTKPSNNSDNFNEIHQKVSITPRRHASTYYSAESSPLKAGPSTSTELTQVDQVFLDSGGEEHSFVSSTMSDSIPEKMKCDTLSPSISEPCSSESGSWGSPYKCVDIHSNESRMAIIKSIISRSTFKMLPDLNKAMHTDYKYFIHSKDQEDPYKPYPFTPKNKVLLFDEEGFVKLPWSISNITNGQRNHVAIAKSLRWVMEEMNSIDTLFVAMSEYSDIEDFTGLMEYYDSIETEEGRKKLLRIISGIAELALRAEKVITKPLHTMHFRYEKKDQASTSVSLTQEQCACLLANAFLCTFPPAEKEFNSFSMQELLSHSRNYLAAEKLKFIFAYFETVLEKMPSGVISFRRVLIRRIPDFTDLPNPQMPLLAFGDGCIEDYDNCLHVDFANRYIGGGVLGCGAVQEEIMFLEKPELMISMLLCPRMNSSEAIFIAGAQKYSSHTGYAKSLRWVPFTPLEPFRRDKFGRIYEEVVAIDAKRWPQGDPRQYEESAIQRELVKCLAGFYTNEDSKPVRIKPIATGNWGCGVFGGDIELKSLIQLIAAGAAKRTLIYVPFDQKEFQNDFEKLYTTLVSKGTTIGTLYDIVLNYHISKKRTRLFDFVMERLK